MRRRLVGVVRGSRGSRVVRENGFDEKEVKLQRGITSRNAFLFFLFHVLHLYNSTTLYIFKKERSLYTLKCNPPPYHHYYS